MLTITRAVGAGVWIGGELHVTIESRDGQHMTLLLKDAAERRLRVALGELVSARSDVRLRLLVSNRPGRYRLSIDAPADVEIRRDELV